MLRFLLLPPLLFFPSSIYITLSFFSLHLSILSDTGGNTSHAPRLEMTPLSGCTWRGGHAAAAAAACAHAFLAPADRAIRFPFFLLYSFLCFSLFSLSLLPLLVFLLFRIFLFSFFLSLSFILFSFPSPHFFLSFHLFRR